MIDNSPPAFLEKSCYRINGGRYGEQGTHDTLLERYILIDLDKKELGMGIKLR
jgi:hypothetical protein